jgi:hypothetical protein
MMRRLPCAILCSVVLAAIAVLSMRAPSARAQEQENVRSLAGKWRFEIDRADAGVRDRWFEKQLTRSISVPGVMAAQGFGDPVTVDTVWTGSIVDRSWFTAPEYARYREPGRIKVPFWLQPDLYYSGVAWYQREMEVPDAWRGRNLVLFLERPHWETTVYLDGVLVGRNDSLSTPHEYLLGTAVPAGRHVLSVRVDNRSVVDIGVNSHSITDHTQGNWNGIVGRVELQARDAVFIDDLQVYPHLGTRSATVRGRIANGSGKGGKGVVQLEARSFNWGAPSKVPPLSVRVSWGKKGGRFEAEYPLGSDARAWDEFAPVLYSLTASLGKGDVRTVTFGLREVSTSGTRIVLNGQPIFLRGTLECAIFPQTGHPPTDVPSWGRIIRIARAYGLNNIRFHSWCPPEAAFLAADQQGFYLQVECASWANQGTKIGVGTPLDKWIYREADRILQAYGNHPSFLLMLYGNEPAGDINKFLGKWVKHYWKKDGRRLYSSGAGWPQLKENQFHVAPDPRIQAWGAGLKSRINAGPPETKTDYREYIQARAVPVVSHEIGQWCAYPNFEEIDKYTGYLKAKNFEIFRDSLVAAGMGDQAHDFLLASGKLQALCYKEEIESALRTPGMGGFQLLDLHDFPGQGTALVGMLDAFWDQKGYITHAEVSRFCNSTVPLARLAKRVFTSTEPLEAELEVAHFGRAPLKAASADWKVKAANGRVVLSGDLPRADIPIGNGTPLGKISVSLRDLPAPARYRLVVGLVDVEAENDWDFWVYPARVDPGVPRQIRLTDRLDSEAEKSLEAGGTVVLMLPPDQVAGDGLGKVELGFSSIFWNTAWTRRQAPHTLGILCDPQHPALAAFPTEFHSNWQWWYIVTRAQAMILNRMPAGLRPIVQVVDDWVTNRKLGLVFEARVGKGRILVSSIDLRDPSKLDPVARQMRASLLSYASSDKFRPAVEASMAQLRGIMVEK